MPDRDGIRNQDHMLQLSSFYFQAPQALRPATPKVSTPKPLKLKTLNRKDTSLKTRNVQGCDPVLVLKLFGIYGQGFAKIHPMRESNRQTETPNLQICEPGVVFDQGHCVPGGCDRLRSEDYGRWELRLEQLMAGGLKPF